MNGFIAEKKGNLYVVLAPDKNEAGPQKKIWLSVRKELGLKRPATPKEAKAVLIAKLAEMQKGQFIEPDKTTVGEVMDEWLRLHGQVNLRESTYDAIESLIRVHIKPEIGDIPLQRLKKKRIQQLLADKCAGARADGAEGGLAESTVNRMYRVLRQALDQAVEWELIRMNPAVGVKPPSIPHGKPPVWTDAEVELFLKRISGHRLRPLYLMALSTGMRKSELLGLRWRDVDLVRRQVSVVNTRVTTAAGRVIDDERTKARSSKRVITLLPSMVAVLKRHQQVQKEELEILGKTSDLVFTSMEGTPIGARNLLRHFQAQADKDETAQKKRKTKKQAGGNEDKVTQKKREPRKQTEQPKTEGPKLPRIPFHGLRHTCATLMLQQGVHPKIVSEMLGHARVGITLDTYSHVLPNMQEEAVKALEGILRLEVELPVELCESPEK